MSCLKPKISFLPSEVEKKWKYDEEVHQLLVDFKKDYDSVRREVLYKILIEFGIPRKLVRWAGHVARMCEVRGLYKVLLGKPGGRRPLGRSRRRWVDNIRMDLQEVGCGYMDRIGLAQDRDRWRTLVSAVMNLRVP